MILFNRNNHYLSTIFKKRYNIFVILIILLVLIEHEYILFLVSVKKFLRIFMFKNSISNNC